MKFFLLCLFACCFGLIKANAQFIGTPELVGFTNASFNFCQGFGLQIKFDAGGMNAGNIISVQLSDSVGNFGAAATIGSMPAGNGQNMFIPAIIPANTPAGPRVPTMNRGYKIRLVSSSPSVVSQTNQFGFGVLKTLPIINPQLTRYGINLWVAHVYTWRPVLPLVNGLVNPAIQNFFDPTNYKGYFVKNALSFDLDWGRGPIPAGNNVSIDSNQVSCEYRENFAIRFRRRENFPLGYYAFQYGSDDGIRMSTDGGATWLFDSFREQQFAPIIPNNGCGIVLGGNLDLVVEYFQRFVQSRILFTMIRTGDPNQLPVFGAGQDGRTFCTSAPPIQLLAAPLGGQFTGSGVSSNGLFNPRTAGLGARNIYYTTGGFGPCQKRDTINLTVNSGSDARFIGLDTAYCLSNTVVQLQSLNVGTFTGPGISGTNFSIASAGVGTHVIMHIAINIAACPDTMRQTVRVYRAPLAITFTLPRTSLCSNEAPIQVNYTPIAGGVFFGRGISATGVFNPQGLNGNIRLVYKVRSGPCSDSVIQQIVVNPALIASFTGLDSAYCTGANAVTLNGSQAIGFFTGSGLVGNRFSPSGLASGRYLIKYIVLGPCPDTAEQIVNIRPSINASFVNLPTSICPATAPITLTGLPAGGTFRGQGLSTAGGVTTFNPAGLSGSVQLRYVASNGTCTDSATASIGITNAPNITLLTDSILCFGSGTYTLRASQQGGTWSGTGVQGDQFNPQLAGIGRYLLTYGLSQSGCAGSVSTYIRVAGISNIQFNKNLTACYNEPIGLTIVSTPITPYSVVITDQTGALLVNGTEATDFSQLKLSQSGNLTIRLFELGTNCQFTYQDAFTAQPNTTALSYTEVALGLQPQFGLDTIGQATFPMLVRLNNQTLALSPTGAVLIPTSAAVKYQVNWGDGQIEVINNLITIDHTYRAETANLSPYTISLKVNDQSGAGFANCLYEATQVLEIKQTRWPNVITPNGDNQNDQMVFDGMAGRGKLSVYNRLGIQVFTEDVLTNKWAAEGLPSGTYYYILTDTTGKAYKGWVDVLR